MPAKPNLRYGLAAAASCFLIMSASAAGAQNTTAVTASYFDVLREGAAAFKTRATGWANVFGIFRRGAEKFQNDLISRNVDQALANLHKQMNAALSTRPGWGILYEVRIYAAPTAPGLPPQKYLVGGRPKTIGIAPSPSEAAAAYLSTPMLEGGSPPPGTVRHRDSYMIWVTLKDGQLRFSRTPHPLEMKVWERGEQLRRQGVITQQLARSREIILGIAAQGAEYAEAAQTAKSVAANNAVKQQIDTMEQQRVAATQSWISAVESLAAAQDRARRASTTTQLASFMQVLTVGLSFAEARSNAQRTKIDGVTAENAAAASTSAQTAAAAAQTASQAATQASQAAQAQRQNLQNLLQKLRQFFQQMPGFPPQDIPPPPSVPAMP